jgi:hypothetical protein
MSIPGAATVEGTFEQVRRMVKVKSALYELVRRLRGPRPLSPASRS